MVSFRLQSFEYSLDRGDRIATVGDPWRAFARENGAPELDGDAVLGNSVFDYIADEPTRSFYQRVFEQVRATDRPVVVPFRCDSPTLRRFMRMEVRHLPPCGIGLKSILERVEPCPRQTLLDAELPTSESAITMCSCCKRVLIEPVGWLAMEDAARQPALVGTDTRPQTRYALCPSCGRLAG
ncbi:MAG: hypothetical protein DWQ37_12840 [Planctomycetota bacterium]|nr:MAG: hypothetical protein DWQ37_12840 [Planctomycetota bacterium]